jgi:hypothetical protein
MPFFFNFFCYWWVKIYQVMLQFLKQGYINSGFQQMLMGDFKVLSLNWRSKSLPIKD